MPSTLREEEECCDVVRMHFLKPEGRLREKCSSTPSNTLPLLMAGSINKVLSTHLHMAVYTLHSQCAVALDD